MIYGKTPFPKRFWGLYKFTVEGRRTLKKEIGREIYRYFCKKDSESIDAFFLTALDKIMTSDLKDETFKNVCRSWRLWQKKDEALSRSHRFTTIFVVHKCDANGLWIPTKEELANAVKENLRQGDEENLTDEAKKYIN